jgi:adenylate kinase family enzyme
METISIVLLTVATFVVLTFMKIWHYWYNFVPKDIETLSDKIPLKINIVGSSGCGKSTLQKKLSSALNLHGLELDALNHLPNWTPCPKEEFLNKVAAFVNENAEQGWVVDGDYGTTVDLLQHHSNVLLWLDYNIFVILPRLFWRTVRRFIFQEELWNGNKESFVTNFCSKDSLFVYVIQSYWRRRRNINKQFIQNKETPMQVVRLRSPRHTELFVEKLLQEHHSK